MGRLMTECVGLLVDDAEHVLAARRDSRPADEEEDECEEDDQDGSSRAGGRDSLRMVGPCLVILSRPGQERGGSEMSLSAPV